MTRREALSMAAGAVSLGCVPSGGPTGGSAGHPSSERASPAPDERVPRSERRQPTVFLPHGGGPWPFMDLAAFGMAGAYDEMERYLRTFVRSQPRALLVVSAHWEQTQPTLTGAERPSLLFDYGGFPPETYQVRWPAPGSLALTTRTRELLVDAGFQPRVDRTRGFDHGVFVPLSLPFPEPALPVVQLSLLRGLDPASHFRLGRALAPLRDEGVLIVGSGMSYHNLRGLRAGGRAVRDDSMRFDAWLREACGSAPEARQAALLNWASAPRARACHPREEHLMPLHVVAGAAADSAARVAFRGELMGAALSAFHFGEA